jgi:hypothetical protein
MICGKNRKGNNSIHILVVGGKKKARPRLDGLIALTGRIKLQFDSIFGELQQDYDAWENSFRRTARYYPADALTLRSCLRIAGSTVLKHPTMKRW